MKVQNIVFDAFSYLMMHGEKSTTVERNVLLFN